MHVTKQSVTYGKVLFFLLLIRLLTFWAPLSLVCFKGIYDFRVLQTRWMHLEHCELTWKTSNACLIHWKRYSLRRILLLVLKCAFCHANLLKRPREQEIHTVMCAVQRWLHFKRTFRVCRHTAGSDISIDFSQGSNEAGWDGKLALLKV